MCPYHLSFMTFEEHPERIHRLSRIKGTIISGYPMLPSLLNLLNLLDQGGVDNPCTSQAQKKQETRVNLVSRNQHHSRRTRTIDKLIRIRTFRVLLLWPDPRRHGRDRVPHVLGLGTIDVGHGLSMIHGCSDSTDSGTSGSGRQPVDTRPTD